MASKYFNANDIEAMNAYRAQIYAIREKMFAEFGVDPLDTDALSSLAIHKIVSQYDADFNVNFARNGEDGKSGDVLIEQKAARVDPNPLTKTNKPRKGYGMDASFAFHVGGEIDHQRYIFVARSSADLSILRIYDISSKANRNIVIADLKVKADAWHAKGFQKHDMITISEKTILQKCKFLTKNQINGCKVFKD